MAIPKRKRKRNISAFGDSLYVPEDQIAGLDLPDIELADYDFGLEEYDTEEVDTEIFDYDRTDNRSVDRYLRPCPSRMPLACVRYDNAEALARELKFKAGMRYDVFTAGAFIFGDFIEAFLRHNNCKALKMTISTLSLSRENVDSLYLLMTKGFIDELRLFVSEYFYSHERRSCIPYIYKKLDIDNRFQFAVARVHTKSVSFLTLGGKKIVMHGSANLRSSTNVEQLTIEDNAKLYDFYEETYDILFDNYKTINHNVVSRLSWNDFEKRLMESTKQTAESENLDEQ